jgi:serine/threonine protein kinase
VCKISKRTIRANENPVEELRLMRLLQEERIEEERIGGCETDTAELAGRHHVVQLLDHVETMDEDWAVLEHCDRGDLFDLVKEQRVTRGECARFFVHMVRGLRYVHSRNIVHRDFSLENVLVKGGDAKLADFGLAQEVVVGTDGRQKEQFNSASAGVLLGGGKQVRIGKTGYLAPEVVSFAPYDGKQADVFALGVCLFQLLASAPPFRIAHSSDRCWKYIESGNLAKLVKGWGLSDRIPDSAVDLLDGLFAQADKRLTLDQVEAHPFFVECRQKEHQKEHQDTDQVAQAHTR